MKFISAGLAAVCAAVLISVVVVRQRSAEPVSAAGRGNGPVIVELFTSEGCSSCPPADAALAKLEESQGAANAEVIALEEHVDYWDRQGWRDPFSSAEFTARQQRYGEWLHIDAPYTPEMFVDGQSEFLGSDSRRALSELARAARTAEHQRLFYEQSRDRYLPASAPRRSREGCARFQPIAGARILS